uniref:C-type lectin domain-containing protein n=1 Tax=Cyclopterus lumpus TaxID=8103 RepID=A0A8C3AE84_CYCLU
CDSDYFYVTTKMNWTDAQQYCREKYSDLATLDSIDDVRRLPDVIGLTWIGLRDDPQSWKYSMGNDTNSWRWSATGGTGRTSRTGYQNWKASQPSGSTESQLCIWMSSGGTWSDAGCETALYFLCYTQTTQTDKTYVLIYMVKKWSDARDYCREHHTDLAMIENDEENKAVAAQLGGYYGWIGLYRVRWTWSDKSQSSFRFWGPGAPQYFHSQEDCVAMRSLHKWDDANCKSEYHFMCHQESTFELIRINKTWVDALDYCRARGTTLASIVDEDTQTWAELQASNSNSPFVWLGLRYTCTLDFWFWVENLPVTFRHWAPNGTIDDCDMSGAMEKHENHLWFSKSAASAFNFLCIK